MLVPHDVQYANVLYRVSSIGRARKGIMWGLFFASVTAATLFLYVPGYLFLRALRVARLASVVCAPLVTVSVYGILTILYAKAGVFCTWTTLVVPALTVCGALCVVGCLVGTGKGRVLGFSIGDRSHRRDWLYLGLYVAVAFASAMFLFVRSLDGLDSFVQDFDNIHHLGVTLGYVESGNWSPFSATLYATADAARINPLPESTFYPAAWNWIAASLVGSIGASVTLAANVVNFVLVVVVFPTNMFLLMRLVFRDAPSVVPFGALVTLGFSAFPWGFFTFGPLYPNMMAFSMLPSVAFCFISLFQKGEGKKTRFIAAVVFCIGLVCFIFSQPNAIFTLGVFLIPFCVYQVARGADRLSAPSSRKPFLKVALCALCIVLIAIVWYAFYSAPFMQGVVTHFWPSFSTKSQALVDVLLLVFRGEGTQIVLASLVVAGILYTLKKREYLWISCAYLMMCVLFIVDVTSDAPVKFLLTGFWYTDSCRVAASAALFAMPLAALGLWLAVRAVKYLLSLASNMQERTKSAVAVCAISGAFLLTNLYPNFLIAGFGAVKTGMGSIASTLVTKNDYGQSRVYDADEIAFVDEVVDAIPAGSLVVNNPDDGSAFSYPTSGLNTYYRYLRTYGEDNETKESATIRNSLSRIGSDERVRAAVDRIGAEYVLVLDQGEVEGDRPRFFTYENGKNWHGIESIRDGTPGFETVLSRGDMRLYRIVGSDETA